MLLKVTYSINIMSCNKKFNQTTCGMRLSPICFTVAILVKLIIKKNNKVREKKLKYQANMCNFDNYKYV